MGEEDPSTVRQKSFHAAVDIFLSFASHICQARGETPTSAAAAACVSPAAVRAALISSPVGICKLGKNSTLDEQCDDFKIKRHTFLLVCVSLFSELHRVKNGKGPFSHRGEHARVAKLSLQEADTGHVVLLCGT